MIDSTQKNWKIKIKPDAYNSSYLRMYMINQATGFIQSAYLFATNFNGEPIKGIFIYVNPDMINPTDTKGMAFVSIAFDMTKPNKNLMTMRIYRYADLHWSYQVLNQCDKSNTNCVAEYLEINEAPPKRSFNTILRSSWSKLTNQTCFSNISYTQEKMQIIEYDCSIITPHWGNHFFTINDLVQRSGDTVPAGGTALEYFVDGVSKSGWKKMKPELIDSWLDGSAY